MILQKTQSRAPLSAHPSIMHTSITRAVHTTNPSGHWHCYLNTLHHRRQSRSNKNNFLCKGTSSTEEAATTTAGPFSALNNGIATFYDASSGLWEDMWGDHLHHGYYPQNDTTPKSNRQAQEDMIDEVLNWAGVTSVDKMVDVGCGLGGSSRHLANKYGCSAQGITLSPFQAKRGNEISTLQGMGERVQLQVADALEQPFADNSFDLIWSLESGEHMPDKLKFVGELARVCAPGGRVILVTWCHRELAPGETELRADEKDLLRRICDAYYLPAWCSAGQYKELFEQNGMVDVRTADWSQEVAPFWGEVIKSAMSVRGVLGLLRAGWTTIKGALVMPLMAQGFNMGLIKFALITGVME